MLTTGLDIKEEIRHLERSGTVIGGGILSILSSVPDEVGTSGHYTFSATVCQDDPETFQCRFSPYA